MNENTIGIELGLPFCLLKGFTNVRVILHLVGKWDADAVGDLTDRRVRELRPAEFFQRFGGETIRPESATASRNSRQSFGITCFNADGNAVLFAVGTVAIVAFEGVRAWR